MSEKSNEYHKNEKYSIEKLFDLKRIKSSKYLLLLYTPIGLCLFIIRLFIFFYLLIVSAILPYNLSLRSIVFRSLFLILGISIDVDEDYFRKLNGKLFISNHITDLDPIIINIILPSCISLMSTNNQIPCYINWLCQIFKTKNLNENINNDDDNGNDKRQQLLSRSTKPIVCFPEQTKTNGRFGLFKFYSFTNNDINIDYSSKIHMIFFETKRPFFKISLSTLNSHWLSDLFWILFLPVTIFKIRHLDIIEKEENENVDEFLRRIQLIMATKTGLIATDFRFNDKRDYIKRLSIENRMNKNNNKRKSTTKTSTNLKQLYNNRNKQLKIDEYSKKVKEILPQVPLNVIKEDIIITNNIDDTVERILTGVVKFIPEKLSTSMNNNNNNFNSNNDSMQSSIQSMLKNTDNKSIIENKNFAAKTFGKTSSERMASFQERKEQMYRMARIRYLKKRGMLNSDLFVE